MRIFRLACLTACLLSLAACACPSAPQYDRTPYQNDRTAGSGMTDQGCFRRTFEWPL